MPSGRSRRHFWNELTYLLALFSHFWLATPQLVLQADWQEVWHSPQPPLAAVAHRERVSRVLILFISAIILWKDSS
jgi:hypothetical protein